MRNKIILALQREIVRLERGGELDDAEYLVVTPEDHSFERVTDAVAMAEQVIADTLCYGDAWPDDIERTSWGIYVPIQRATYDDDTSEYAMEDAKGEEYE